MCIMIHIPSNLHVIRKNVCLSTVSHTVQFFALLNYGHNTFGDLCNFVAGLYICSFSEHGSKLSLFTSQSIF